MEGGLRLSRHDEGEYAYLWRSCVIGTGKDNVAVAFARHVLTPPVLSADVYRRMVAVWHWLLCGWQFQQILVDSGQSVTYSVARVYPSSVRLLEGRWWITCSLRRELYVQRIQAHISLRLAHIAPLTRVKRSLSVPAVVRPRMVCWPVVMAVTLSPAVLLCPELAAVMSYSVVSCDWYVVLYVCSSFPFVTAPVPVLRPTQPAA
jgi:hypothetical protein